MPEPNVIRCQPLETSEPHLTTATQQNPLCLVQQQQHLGPALGRQQTIKHLLRSARSTTANSSRETQNMREEKKKPGPEGLLLAFSVSAGPRSPLHTSERAPRLPAGEEGPKTRATCPVRYSSVTQTRSGTSYAARSSAGGTAGRQQRVRPLTETKEKHTYTLRG